MSLSNLQLTPQFVQAVRDAVDVHEVAAAYTKLTRAGRKWKGLCPLHKEKTPSFHVDPELGFFKCFGCGEGGDAIKLHMLLSGDDFPAAIESLAHRFGVPLPAPAARHRGARGRSEGARDPEQVLEAAAAWFRDQLVRSDFARRYLEQRRIPEPLAERFGLGYAPDGWRNLLGALPGSCSVGDLLDVGLAVRPDGGGEPYDRFRHRLIFPIRNAAGRLMGFGGRTLGDDPAKYLNTAENERFHKGQLLYGLDLAKRAIREARRVFLVEGYLDVVAAVASGVDEAVASMGTALTPEQSRLLARFADEVVLGYDGDAAGETACRRALPLLLAETLAVRRARMPEGGDPDSLRLGQGEAAVRSAVDEAEDFLIAELRRLVPADVSRDPHGRWKAGREFGRLLQPIRDPVLRYNYGRLAADRLGVPVPDFLRGIGVDTRSMVEALRPAAGPTPGRGAEEAALRELLTARDLGVALPDLATWPPPEAFLDPLLREYFAAFVRLYEAGEVPGAREVLREVGDLPGAHEKAASILLDLEGLGVGAPPGSALLALRRRWLRFRLEELKREISESQSQGDAVRLERLLAEKAAVNDELHPRAAASRRAGAE